MQLVGQMQQVLGAPHAHMQHVTNSRPGIPWDYFNLISNGFLRKGETDEQKAVEGRQRYDAALAARLLSSDKERPELIILAGWMHVFSSAFLEPIERAGVRIINLHPALPGKFQKIMFRLALIFHLLPRNYSQFLQDNSTGHWQLSERSKS